jgi:hypothetical protein
LAVLLRQALPAVPPAGWWTRIWLFISKESVDLASACATVLEFRLRNVVQRFYKVLLIDTIVFKTRLITQPSILHTASFWNIIIQWTSHDDLTEKTILPKPPMKWWWWSFYFVKWQKLKLYFVIWQKNYLCLTSFYDQIFKSFWKPSLEFFFQLYQFLLYFLQFKFFPPWMACFNPNINDLEFK